MTTSRILSPEEIAVQAGQQVPFLHLPERATAFAEREMRLRHLGTMHTMSDFLLFAADLANAQSQLLQSYPQVALPDAAALSNAARAGMPPLPATLWPRDAHWRSGFRRLIDHLLPLLANSPARDAVATLRDKDDAWLEQQADKLLHGVMLGLDMAAAPLVAAALQVYWTHLVIATGNGFGRTDAATHCPCCGSRPTASVSRIGAEVQGFRYLHCSLCSTQWHMVRIKCTNCESTKGIHYQSLQRSDDDRDGDDGRAGKPAIEAETCDECGHYLKIVHMERDPHVEPVADDLASVTLDLLVADAGFERHGVNLMLLFGDPDVQDGG